MKIICPDEEVIADYLEGRLCQDDRSELESHASDCDLCLEEFTAAKSLCQTDDISKFDPVPGHVTDAAVALVTGEGFSRSVSVKEKVIECFRKLNVWISDHLQLKTFMKYRLAVVRGTPETRPEDLFHVEKAFEEIRTDIEIEKTGSDLAAIRVNVIGDRTKKKDVRVSLVNEHEREVSSFLLNGGFVIFEEIQFGRYRLVFRRNGRKLGTYRFEIKETPVSASGNGSR